MTKRVPKVATHKRLMAAYKARELAMRAVYACAPNRETPFRDCLAAAPATVQMTFRNACEAMADVERSAVRLGVGYYDQGRYVDYFEPTLYAKAIGAIK